MAQAQPEGGALGPLADAAGEVRIRDRDQTVLGDPAHDAIRLGLALSTAARGFDLPVGLGSLRRGSAP